MVDEGTFLRALKDGVHRSLGFFGVEVRLRKNLVSARKKEKQEAEREKWRVLRRFKFATVLDIGANEGQFAAEIRRECPDATVYCFEPIPDVFARLKANVSRDGKVVPVNVGVGEKAGVLTMNRSDFSPSSSLLAMAGRHKEEWPQSATHTSVDVQVKRLDDWARESEAVLEKDLLVKMDVQGYELAVIRGAESVLRQARLVIAEVSFEELYEGQPLFADIHRAMESLGFRYCGNLEQHCSTRSNRILFADAIFENMNKELTDV